MYSMSVKVKPKALIRMRLLYKNEQYKETDHKARYYHIAYHTQFSLVISNPVHIK